MTILITQIFASIFQIIKPRFEKVTILITVRAQCCDASGHCEHVLQQWPQSLQRNLANHQYQPPVAYVCVEFLQSGGRQTNK
jgi:hypothetical protein